MKDTRKVRKFIQSVMDYYVDRMNVKPVPTIIYKLEQLHALESGLKRFKPYQKFAMSIFNSKECHTFINIKKHPTAGDLIDTIVHELVHVKHPNLRHSKKFDDMVDNIIMGSIL